MSSDESCSGYGTGSRCCAAGPARVDLEPADRAWLSALTRLPPPRWSIFGCHAGRAAALAPAADGPALELPTPDRISRVVTNDLTIDDRHVLLKLGNTPIELPEPLASHAGTLLATRSSSTSKRVEASTPNCAGPLLYRLVILGAAGEAETAARPPVPDLAGKARAWHTIIDADGFFHPEHAELTAPCVARYFTEMPAMAARRTPHAVHQVALSAYPNHAASTETMTAALAMLACDDLDPALRRVATDDLRRALAARAQARRLGA